MIAVGIKAVSKSYDGKTLVLDRIDLEVQQGEMFFLLGASGCGLRGESDPFGTGSAARISSIVQTVNILSAPQFEI